MSLYIPGINAVFNSTLVPLIRPRLKNINKQETSRGKASPFNSQDSTHCAPGAMSERREVLFEYYHHTFVAAMPYIIML